MSDEIEKTAKPRDHRKQSVYFQRHVLEKLESESARQKRSLSFLVQFALKQAWPDITSLPSMDTEWFDGPV